MKNVMIFSLLLVAFAACSSVSQYNESVNNLTGNWNTATQDLTNISQQVQEAKSKWVKESATLLFREDLKAKLTADQTQTLQNLDNTIAGYTKDFNTLNAEVENFMKQWLEKQKDLDRLNAALRGAKFDGNMQQTINDLNETVSTAKTDMRGWQERLDALKGSSERTKREFKDLLAKVDPESARAIL